MRSRILCVGGTFDDTGGKPSGYFTKLVANLTEQFNDYDIISFNGGTWTQLTKITKDVETTSIVFWMADVPNDKPKLVASIKQRNPNVMLVTSKNNMSGQYDRRVLAARALSAKANLLIEFTRNDSQSIVATIIDPLGNQFSDKEANITTVATTLSSRLRFLLKMVRVGSIKVGENVNVVPSDDITHFFKLVASYASEFHELIHQDDNGRMLGNLSFRCESGFPSIRQNDTIFVSRRNVDKRDIGIESMVPVILTNSGDVEYLGDSKPSVDTPIQRQLYVAWPKANFMLHAHVYIDGAPFTDNVVPCGAMQEVDEILRVLPEFTGDTVAYINLRGHGSLAVGNTVQQLAKIPYISRAVN